MKYLRWLLIPFSLLYGLAVIFRNFCYDAGLFKSKSFDKPVISVGNLDVGGAGKSPMTEYLIRLLKNDYKLATLSRGYGRKTKGYLTATATATNLGDEPAQFKVKFPDITVAVCEKRVDGIKKLLPDHDVILLDDAYQHRAVTPGFSILLFDYNRLFEPHLLLPAGNLREPFSGRWRAQIIVVTKCPGTLSDDEKSAAVQRIEPLPYQKVFYSHIAYQHLITMSGEITHWCVDNEMTVFLLTGIANPKPLLQHLSGYTSSIIHHNYPDHHPFTPKNIAKLAAEFSACKAQKKLVITTEKDAQRLEQSWFKHALPGGDDVPVFVLPIKIAFWGESGEEFDQLIIDYVREYTTHNRIH
ncbi:MAG TPA: tetraacyldisaccharide 4'-kinase [Mucilaginibacter sp.]|jgi:tetraacyldisaccharide 4'-kinase|nr:tetraacyldisaccharide 4'-kinase [Mucilaginibacter sp.]